MGPCLSNYSCPVKYEIIDNFLEIEMIKIYKETTYVAALSSPQLQV